MKQRLVIGGIGAILAALWVASADVAAQAQAAAGRQGESNAQTPRRANGVPDFSGLWVPTQRRGELPDAFDPKTGNYRTNVRQHPNRQSGGLRARPRNSDAHVRAREQALVQAGVLGARDVQRRPRALTARPRPDISVHARRRAAHRSASGDSAERQADGFPVSPAPAAHLHRRTPASA